MRLRIFFYSIMACLITILLLRCSSGISEQNTSKVQYLSHLSMGCLPSSGLAKINDNPSINWKYSSGVLRLELLFSTLCSATLKDSVISSNDSLNIFIKDVNSAVAMCTCPYKEIFSFLTSGGKNLKIVFRFKQYFKMEYTPLADTTIYLY